MLARRSVGVILAAALIAALLAIWNLSPAAAQGTTLLLSQPDEAALYLGDLAYLRDTLTLPAGEAVQIVLPATALPQSIRITEGEERVRVYRFAAAGGGVSAPTVTWDPPSGDAPRQIVLEYLATGAGWGPLYDMTVLADDRVQFGFDAEIRSTALALDGAEVRLVAGMPGAQPGYQPQINVTQSNVGYADVGAAATGGPVQVQHVYEVGALTLAPGDVLRVNLLSQPLDARRLLVWDARLGQRVDVIYKVANSTDVPFVEGSVNAYQDGLYVGQDAIEWTPSGSEGSVTIAGLSDLRVRRTESVEVIGSFGRVERYRHDVTLAISNHSAEAVALTVLDEWNTYGYDFTFSREPQRQGNNVLRWELDVPAGESVEITYTYFTE